MDSTVCWLTPSLCAATESHAMLLPPHCSPHTCLHGMGKGRRGHWHRAMRRHGLGCTQGGTTALAWWPDINTGSPKASRQGSGNQGWRWGWPLSLTGVYVCIPVSLDLMRGGGPRNPAMVPLNWELRPPPSHLGSLKRGWCLVQAECLFWSPWDKRVQLCAQGKTGQVWALDSQGPSLLVGLAHQPWPAGN